MKQILITLTTLMILPLIGEPSCPSCELHKTYNKDHPGDYEYYDDYLKATKEKEEPKKDEPVKKAKSL